MGSVENSAPPHPKRVCVDREGAMHVFHGHLFPCRDSKAHRLDPGAAIVPASFQSTQARELFNDMICVTSFFPLYHVLGNSWAVLIEACKKTTNKTTLPKGDTRDGKLQFNFGKGTCNFKLKGCFFSHGKR